MYERVGCCRVVYCDTIRFTVNKGASEAEPVFSDLTDSGRSVHKFYSKHVDMPYSIFLGYIRLSWAQSLKRASSLMQNLTTLPFD